MTSLCLYVMLLPALVPASPAVPSSASRRAMSDIDCRVRTLGGVPTFVINGRPHSGLCYSTYDCSHDNLSRRVGQFAEAGCDLFNFVVEISGYGYSRPMWVARDRWDFTDLDQRARTVLAAGPHAMLLPRIYLDAPEWWRAENPGEMMVLDNGATSFGEKLFALPCAGPYPSLASEAWRRDMAYALQAVIDHIERSNYGGRVVGYQLSGQKTEEWYHWSMNCPLLGDYSLPMQRAFRGWLRVKYLSDDALRAAWHRDGVTLDTAPIPTRSERFGDQTRTFRDPTAERHVIDFHAFWSDIMADTIAYFAKVVKEKTRGRKVVGAFYAYTFEFAELGEDAGHLAVHRLLRCPDLDFIMAPSSYFDRNLPGKPYFRAPIASLVLHGKMAWDDFDQVSFKWYDKLKQDPALAQWEYQMGLTKTPEEFVWMNRREVGMALAQGAQLCHFDIHGGYYEDPTILAGVKRLGEVRREDLPLLNRGSNAQVLVLVDEESEHYLTFRNPLLTTLLSAQLAEMGFVAPYDAALLSDLPVLDPHRYRLVVMLNAFRVDRATSASIAKKLKRGGRTIVWVYAPGYFDERGGEAGNMAKLTGINVIADGVADGHESATVLPPYADLRATLSLPRGDRFRVDDPQAEPIAARPQAPGTVVVARRRFAGWTSVYTAAAPLPAALLKRLAAEAGVHIYDDDPTHLVFANRHWLTVAASADGGRVAVRLPRRCAVVEAATGERIAEAARHFTAQLQPNEVRLFALR